MSWQRSGRHVSPTPSTFLFIGQVWANHHVMFDHIRAADRVILLLNTLLLIVAFLPFTTSVLAGHCMADTANGPRPSFTASHPTRRP
jgi:uncharacterized membrane protein